MRTRKKESDPLGRKDYISYWAGEARNHAKALEWKPDRVPAVLGELEAVFGGEWLRSAAARESRYPMTGDPKKHPVGHLLASPHRFSVMSLIELAVYLRSCRDMPRFGEVLDHLRTPEQFTTGRMQLALAHRFRRAGATDVEFEPRVDGGRKADLFFQHDARSHLVECYEPAPDRNSHLDDLLHEGIHDRILAAAKEARRRVIIRIDLHGTVGVLDAALRKRIEQEAKYLIRSLTPPGLCEKKRLERFTIEVLDTAGVAENDAHELARSMARPGCWLLAPATVLRCDVPKISRGVEVPRTRAGWFVVNYDPDDTVDEMRRLADTIEKKLGQVRRASDDALGIMVPITGFARLASKFGAEAGTLITSLHGKVLTAHEGLAGVLVVDRVEDEHRGPYLCGLFMQGRDGRHLDSLHGRLETNERERRVIDDWVD
jgi:hypothetical protein